jgi:hypothetical protein
MAGVERTVERIRATGEVFTPTDLVLEMLEYLGPEALAPGKTVLDPACGDGQFLVAAKAVKMSVHGMSEEDALAEIYGVDIMRDNVDVCRRRLGGGTIIMGNALKPSEALPEQSDDELALMIELFEEPGESTIRRKQRVAGKKPKSSSPRRAKANEVGEDLALF